MNTLQNEILKTKKLYRELFKNAQDAIDRQINALKRETLCSKCKSDCDIDFNKISVFQEFPAECRYRFWQEAALDLLVNKISKDVYEKIKTVDEKKNNFSCDCCASCCRLASSEYSFEELSKRAENGDKFSKDFVSIFIPYENRDDAREIYPDYVDLIEKKFEYDAEIHFYHCPKIGDDGLCTDYENRPQICSDFPTNPLVAFPLRCSYNQWKEEVEITALTLHALVDIIGFYKEKLQELVKN